MSRIRIVALTIVAGLGFTLPGAAQDDATFVGELGAGVRTQAFETLKVAAENQGLELEADPTFLTQGESTLIFAPIARIGYFTRAQFVDWTTVGIFTAIGPADAEQAPGTFTAQVRAKAPDSSEALFRIVDSAGETVQEGETVLDTNPDNPSPNPDAMLESELTEGKGYYFGGRFGCPWYYPYFRPYYYRAWPIYKNGCHRFFYRWWWGHLHLRFCWWPNRYCVNCRHHW